MSNTQSDAEIRGLAAEGNGVYQDDETAVWEITDPSLIKFARAVLAKWGTPQPVVREPLTDYKAYALIDSMGWSLDDQEKDDMLRLLRTTEAAHGIKGGQHGSTE